MIEIRPEQYQSFEQAEWRKFVASAIQHVREDLPELATELSDADLAARVEIAVRRGEGFGLTTEYDLLCFLDASLLLNDACFDANPKYAPIRSVLQDASLESDDKAEQVLTLAFQQRPELN